MLRARRLSVVVPLLLLGLLVGVAGIATAASPNISRSYSGNDDIVTGSLVSLDASQEDYVQAANLETANRLVGITVAVDDSLVAIDSDENKLQIATSGVANALVTDVNGAIKSGDQIAVSPFSGFGMKASPGSRIIGLAQTTLGSGGADVTTKEVTDKTGKKRSVKAGFVQVSIAIGSVPFAEKEKERNFLQEIVKSITGKYISTARLVISTFIAVIALIALVTLIYTSVYGTIVAIGRNPLAKASIFRALLSVMGLVLVTATVALITIYLIIR